MKNDNARLPRQSLPEQQPVEVIYLRGRRRAPPLGAVVGDLVPERDERAGEDRRIK